MAIKKLGLSIFQIKEIIINFSVLPISKRENDYIVFDKNIDYHQKVNNMILESIIKKSLLIFDDIRKSEIIKIIRWQIYLVIVCNF